MRNRLDSRLGGKRWVRLRWLLVAAACVAPLWLGSCSDDEGTTTPSGQPGTTTSSGQPGEDAGTDTGTTCTPASCSPCDCGSVDDGCGGTLDCGACPQIRSCTEIYGSEDGFLLCEETDEQCSFSVTKAGRTCSDVCESSGGRCLATYGNGTGCETVYDDLDIGCQANDHVDDVCVCSRVTNDDVPAECRDAGASDGGTAPEPPPVGSMLLYRVTFENGTTDANPGSNFTETQNGGTIAVVDNPAPDGRNSSTRVGRHRLPDGYTRAELTSGRVPTVDQTLIYRISYYVPSSMFDQTIDWAMSAQWKTWPCAVGNGFEDEICGHGGIFNHLMPSTDAFRFDFRAVPDCYDAPTAMITDQWVEFVQLIHWTNSNAGYTKIWQNAELVYERQGFKTLFDGFDPSSCNIRLAIGLYATHTGTIELYTDNIEIWEA